MPISLFFYPAGKEKLKSVFQQNKFTDPVNLGFIPTDFGFPFLFRYIQNRNIFAFHMLIRFEH